eukprot:CAMPEP_0197022938 /NCGR_PEP_ID=MMETSP1384-20130603/3734_1 /TAXON_ID=29189 /ORGANISM="Ammonia sp." /LENGTH=322 /DNA_ID=CAMNT_0042451065 /DNA_START=31 /DNA_END=996 /DNA_ORIENTATION=+
MATENSNKNTDRWSKDDEWIMGIDEAGRGPVLGAMLYGACICPTSKLEELKKTGVFDSKQLTDEKRRDLFKMIQSSNYLEWLVDAIPADWMSECMIQQNRYSLNEISHESAMNLIQITLDRGYNLKHVYLDTVGPPEAYERKLINRFMGFDVKFTVSKKADALYPVVSAASICAKVVRDDILNQWCFAEKHLQHLSGKQLKQASPQANATEDDKEEEGDIEEASDQDDEDEDDDVVLQQEMKKQRKSSKKNGKSSEMDDCWLGNGYPGHEKTKQFMDGYCDKIFGYPNIVRFSWQTAKTILEERCANVSFSDQTASNNLSKW